MSEAICPVPANEELAAISRMMTAEDAAVHVGHGAAVPAAEAAAAVDALGAALQGRAPNWRAAEAAVGVIADAAFYKMGARALLESRAVAHLVVRHRVRDPPAIAAAPVVLHLGLAPLRIVHELGRPRRALVERCRARRPTRCPGTPVVPRVCGDFRSLHKSALPPRRNSPTPLWFA